MSLQFEVNAGGGPPAGFYRSKFVDVEPTTHDEFGDGLKFIWEVVAGDHKGEQATRITSAKPTPKNAAGRMLSGLTGKTLAPKAKIDLAPCVGRIYLVQVSETQNGSTRVETVMPAEAQGDDSF